jgi:hypothetical protein
VIEPYRVSTEAIRDSVASLPDAGRRDLATALQALSQLVAAQDATQTYPATDNPRKHWKSLYYRVAQQERTIQLVELLWLG